jgi:hypothetical protein
MKKIYLFVVTFLLSLTSLGQNLKRKCVTYELDAKKLKENLAYQQRRVEIENSAKNHNPTNNYRAGNVLTISVVVHVIHNGEPVGTGQNISDAQITSQIEILNKDFRRLNSNLLPANHVFYPLVADCEIEFCLAAKDANGNSTTGITRYNLNKAAWTVDDFDAQVKPSTAWDRTKYLNLWVTTFDGDDASTLGYATMPGTNDVTDGVVIAAKYFGLSGNANAPFDLGRTATHEIGHYLDLAHIWGDADCGDDQVADTEPQKAESSGCPTFPSNANNGCSGANGEMFMNYLDYSDDNCMSMFTAGQKNKMRAALTGARASLLTTNVCANATNTEYVASRNVQVYPNPAENQITVKLHDINKYEQISLTDINGKVLITKIEIQNIDATFVLNVDSLPNGYYILLLSGESGVQSVPLTIIK